VGIRFKKLQMQNLNALANGSGEPPRTAAWRSGPKSAGDVSRRWRQNRKSLARYYRPDGKTGTVSITGGTVLMKFILQSRFENRIQQITAASYPGLPEQLLLEEKSWKNIS